MNIKGVSMRSIRSTRALKLAVLLALAVVTAGFASASSARVVHLQASHSRLKLGDYRVKTSPALESFTTKVERERYVMEFKLARRAANACGGPKRSKATVYCLWSAYRIGEYGTESTTNDTTLCSGQGYPVGVLSQGWMPVLRLPSSGRISLTTVVKNQGAPAAKVWATFKITPRGRFTGTFKETDYVTTGSGPEFLGCTTGKLTLSGKWDGND